MSDKPNGIRKPLELGKRNGKSRDKAINRKPDDREAVIARTEGGEPIVSTQAVLNATGAYGAIDTLAPGQRLQVLIDTAIGFRKQNPNLPKRAAELAVDEVLRLRDRLAEEREWSERSKRNFDALRESVVAEGLRRYRSRWFRLGKWLGFYS